MEKKKGVFYRVDHVVTQTLKYISFVSGVAMIVVALLATSDVIMSKVFGSGFPNATEIIQYMLIPIVYCSCAYLAISQGLINVDLLMAKLPKAVRMGINALSDLLGAGVSAYMGYYAFVRLMKLLSSGEKSSTSSYGFALWPFGVIYFMGMALLCAAMLWRLAREFAAPELNAPAPPVDTPEPEERGETKE